MVRLRREMPMRGKGAFPSVLPKIPEKMMLPTETQKQTAEDCPIETAEGKIAAKTLYLYPPGSPLIAAGERFDKEVIETVLYCKNRGYTVHNTEKNLVAVIK
jgi:arginine decarboxylase